jgi:endonuclease/exonuclease/phosphatase family metal-dependent hydrolase
MINYRREFFRLVEAGAVGLFLIQAVRFLFTILYAHISSASFVLAVPNPGAIANVPGFVVPADVQVEAIAVAIAAFVPLLSIVLNRAWFGPALAAIGVAAGRVFMASDPGQIGVVGAAITAGAGMLYIATIAVRRPAYAPVAFVIGFALDQLIRLYGQTADPTWTTDFLNIQTILSVGLFIIAVVAALLDRTSKTNDPNPELPGEISGWSAFALAGLLYLEFVIFGLPNTIAHRAGGGLDYRTAAPFLVAATLLPLVAEVRDLARRFLGMFDAPYRGWIWFFLNILLVILGFRLQGIPALVALIAAQIMIGLSWWWIVQPSDGRRLFTGPSVVFSLLLFAVLCGGDFFTYEYAFVRNVPYPLDEILRSLRGLGLVIALFAVLLTGLPAILARKRLPWRGGRITETLLALIAVAAGGVLAYTLASPTVITPQTAPADPSKPLPFRVATLNLHGGYSLYFAQNFADTRLRLLQSGADVILLQEVETGRLISGGIDQPEVLARELGMQVLYFPTNESLQGLAILTRLSVVQTSGLLLTSIGRQTGVQFARLQTANGAVYDIYNTQLGLPLINSTDQDQDRQIQEIIAYAGQNGGNGRVIVGGTFNSLPDPNNLIYAYMKQRGFNDLQADARVEKSFTLTLASGDQRRVDYLWTTNGVKVEQADTLPIAFSNHNAVIIQISALP